VSFDEHLPERSFAIEQFTALCADQCPQLVFCAGFEVQHFDVVGHVEVRVVLPVRQVERVA